jgi:hypothetical protein
VENNKTINNNNNNNTRITLKSQLSLQTSNDLWDNKTKKKRQHSGSLGNQNNLVPRKPGRPKRDVKLSFFSSSYEFECLSF